MFKESEVNELQFINSLFKNRSTGTWDHLAYLTNQSTQWCHCNMHLKIHSVCELKKCKMWTILIVHSFKNIGNSYIIPSALVAPVICITVSNMKALNFSMWAGGAHNKINHTRCQCWWQQQQRLHSTDNSWLHRLFGTYAKWAKKWVLMLDQHVCIPARNPSLLVLRWQARLLKLSYFSQRVQE